MHGSHAAYRDPAHVGQVNAVNLRSTSAIPADKNHYGDLTTSAASTSNTKGLKQRRTTWKNNEDKNNTRKVNKASSKGEYPAASTPSFGTANMVGRLEELLVLELCKDGCRSYLNLSVRGLYKHVITCITSPRTAVAPTAGSSNNIMKHQQQQQQPSNSSTNIESNNKSISNTQDFINKNTMKEVGGSNNLPTIHASPASRSPAMNSPQPQQQQQYLPEHHSLTQQSSLPRHQSLPPQMPTMTTSLSTSPTLPLTAILYNRSGTSPTATNTAYMNPNGDGNMVGITKSPVIPRPVAFASSTTPSPQSYSTSSSTTNQSQIQMPALPQFSQKQPNNREQQNDNNNHNNLRKQFRGRQVSVGTFSEVNYNYNNTYSNINTPSNVRSVIQRTRSQQVGEIPSHPDNIELQQHLQPTAPVTYRERLGAYIHPRDMRRLVTPFSTSNEPELIVRRHVMLLNFDPLRAIILRDRLLVLVPDGADSILVNLEQRVRGGLAEVENSIFGGTGTTGNSSTHGGTGNTKTEEWGLDPPMNDNQDSSDGQNNVHNKNDYGITNYNYTDDKLNIVKDETKSAIIISSDAPNQQHHQQKQLQPNESQRLSMYKNTKGSVSCNDLTKCNTDIDDNDKNHRYQVSKGNLSKSTTTTTIPPAAATTSSSNSNNSKKKYFQIPRSTFLFARSHSAGDLDKITDNDTGVQVQGGGGGDGDNNGPPDSNVSVGDVSSSSSFDSYDDDAEWDEIEGREWINLPFELQSVDAVLFVVGSILTEDTQALKNMALDYIHKLVSSQDTGGLSYDDPLTVIRTIKDSVRELTSRVKGFVQSMNRILDEDEDMALMNLSRLLSHPERFIQPVPQEVLEEESDEPELILEANLQIALTLMNSLDLIKGQIDTASELVDQKLDAQRNRLLFANMVVSVFSLCVTTAAVVASFFGMNVVNGYQDEENTDVFKKIVYVSIAGTCLMAIMILIILFCSGTIPRTSIRSPNYYGNIRA